MRNKAEKKLIYQLTAGPTAWAAWRGVCIELTRVPLLHT